MEVNKGMLATALVALVLVGLAACSKPDLASEAIDFAKQAIKHNSGNDGSEKFRDVHYFEAGPGYGKVCGHFDAKNENGGYTGFKRFIFYYASEQAVEKNMPSSMFNSLVYMEGFPSIGTDMWDVWCQT